MNRVILDIFFLKNDFEIGVKMQTIKKGQLIMDLDFKWGGDPSIILAVRTPVGANLPIQVRQFHESCNYAVAM